MNFATDTVLTEAEALAAKPPLSPEQIAPHFPLLEITQCLGRGGMGVVYKARQKSLNRTVALKLLAPERVADAKFAQRFATEAQALARLNHPNIVTVYDFGQAGGFFYLLMEFVDGVNLRQLLRARKLQPAEALAIVPPICDALQYAHDQGIVHRDIKPENLLLDKNGRAKIADFGIAKMLDASPPPPGTPEMQLAGTPQYMAPEQHTEPQNADHRADIYSLGVVLYELLTGELPADKLEPPSRKVLIDVRLDEIVLRALEKTPELRFQTAGEFRTQVETVINDVARVPPRPPTDNPSPRLLKVGASTITTPELLATAGGQFFCYRTRGQLILDDRQITHARDGMNTVIPLAAIRDLSIGQYPRTMNPAGINFLRVIFEEGGGQQKHLLLSPMKGWFATPSTFNTNVAEWHAAIREAVIAATGRAPTSSPVEKVGTPLNSFVPMLTMGTVLFFIFAGLMMFIRRKDATGGFLGAVGVFEAAVFAVSFLLVVLLHWLLAGRLRQPSRGNQASRLLGLCLLLAGLAVGGWRVGQEHTAHQARFISLSRQIYALQREWQAAKAEEFAARTAVGRFEVKAMKPRSEAERQQNQIERVRLTNEVSKAIARGENILGQVQATTDAINHLAFPTAVTFRRALWPALPLLVGSLLLLFHRGPSRFARIAVIGIPLLGLFVMFNLYFNLYYARQQQPAAPRAAAPIKPSEKILSPVASADLKTLSWHAFDQTPGQYWRALADQKRFVEAAQLIEAYLALHPELEEGTQKVNGANVHFHAAQCWAFAGRTAEATKHLALSRNDPKWEEASGLKWNDYVSGTEAFLRGDRDTLQAMRERLANAPDTNQPNLAVLDRLIANFGRPYAEAYGLDRTNEQLSTPEKQIAP